MSKIHMNGKNPKMLSLVYKLKFTEFELTLSHKDIFTFLAQVASFHVVTLQFSSIFEEK